MIQKEILEKERAIVETDLENIFITKSPLRIIVMCPESLKKYESQLKSINIPVVDQDWIRNCILDNRFLLPDRFSIRTDRPQIQERSGFQVNLEALDKMMERIDSSDKMMNYLMNCVIYVSKLDPEEEKCQQRLIVMGGGAHMFAIIPNVTHIVADKYTEEQARDFNKFSNVFVISSKWLRDCMYFKTRAPENEYITKPIKKVPTESET